MNAKPTLPVIATVAAATVAAALVSTAALAGGACLRQANIYNWDALDNRTVIVEDDFHKKFKLTLMTPCLNMQYHENLGFKTFGATQLTCVSRGDEILSGSPIGPQHCPISKIEVYTPEMEKADKDAKAAAKKD